MQLLVLSHRLAVVLLPQLVCACSRWCRACSLRCWPCHGVSSLRALILGASIHACVLLNRATSGFVEMLGGGSVPTELENRVPSSAGVEPPLRRPFVVVVAWLCNLDAAGSGAVGSTGCCAVHSSHVLSCASLYMSVNHTKSVCCIHCFMVLGTCSAPAGPTLVHCSPSERNVLRPTSRQSLGYQHPFLLQENGIRPEFPGVDGVQPCIAAP